MTSEAALENRIAEALPEWIAQRPDLRARLRTLLLPGADAPAEPVPYAAFLERDEGASAEWVDGVVERRVTPNLRHQQLVLFLAQIIGIYVEHRGLGTVLVSPFQMKLARTGREPDVMFVTAAHRERLAATHLDGPADLVVEIVSPESVSRDRGEKYVEYEAAGVPEYWLIDPDRQQAEFYRLDPDGRYRLASPDASGRFESAIVPGLRLDIDGLWQDPLPPTLVALRDLGVV